MTLADASRAMTKTRMVWRTAFQAALDAARDQAMTTADKAVFDEMGVEIQTEVQDKVLHARAVVDGVVICRDEGPPHRRAEVTERLLARLKARDLKGRT